MVRLNKGLHAPSDGYRPTGTNRSKAASLSKQQAVRIQVSNVPVRN